MYQAKVNKVLSFTNKLRQIYNLSIFSQKKKKKKKNNLVFLQAIEPI